MHATLDTAGVLVVANAGDAAEITAALGGELTSGPIEVAVGSGGDETLSLFAARRPEVVVVAATLDAGDARSLITAIRDAAPGGAVRVVLIGDLEGPIRNALDASDFTVDRFVVRPLSAKALRYAVASAITAVRITRTARAEPSAAEPSAAPVTVLPEAAVTRLGAVDLENMPALIVDRPPTADLDDELAPPVVEELSSDHPAEGAVPSGVHDLPTRRESSMQARWEAIADSLSVEPSMGWSDGRRETTQVLSDRLSYRIETAAPVPPAEEIDLTGPTAQAWEAEASEPVSDGSEEPDDLDEVSSGGINLGELSETRAVAVPVAVESAEGSGFARQLRRKMSEMAERLFGGDGVPSGPVEVGPSHGHHTEINLAEIGEEPRAFGLGAAFGLGDTIAAPDESSNPTERGELAGRQDVAALLGRLWRESFAGRAILRHGEVEKTIDLDAGRPVFASSNLDADRMGQLLVREGKITDAQFRRCDLIVRQTGRRMGEVLVEHGYLKRRELLPAVRHHVEEIIYSLFGWETGSYELGGGTGPEERIRLSRHPAAMVLEGVRRKLGLAQLERLIGPSVVVVEIPDRAKLDPVATAAELSLEERTVLGAMDGRADLAQLIRATGVDAATVYALAYGLAQLGLANLKGSPAGDEERDGALVGETDLAIDRERVQARHHLVGDADYFALLGVRRDATAFEIRRAYESARRDFSAETFPGELRRELATELAEIAEILDEAYAVLRDDPLRRSYLEHLVD